MEAFWSDPTAQRNAERAALSSSASYGPKLEALFDEYAQLGSNDDKDVWSIDATLKWCEDLEIDPEDPVMLAVAHMCKAKEMGAFARADWVNAWKLARKDSLAGQRTHIETLRADLQNAPATFRKIYTYAFDYAREPGQRSLACETACALWDLLLPLAPASLFEQGSAWSFSQSPATARPWLDRWKAFLVDPQGGKGRPISKDVYAQVRGSLSRPAPQDSTDSSSNSRSSRPTTSLPTMRSTPGPRSSTPSWTGRRSRHRRPTPCKSRRRPVADAIIVQGTAAPRQACWVPEGRCRLGGRASRRPRT
jgi:hypothetical protein